MQPFYSLHNTRRIGRYWKNLIDAMLSLDDDNKYFFINFYGNIPAFRKIGRIHSPKFDRNIFFLDFYNEAKQYLAQDFNTRSSEFFKEKINGIFAEYNIELLFLGTAVDQYSVYSPDFLKTTDCKLVCIVHDLIPLIFKDKYLSGDNVNIYFNQLKIYTACDLLFAISDTTKNDAINLLGIEKESIKTIYAGIDTRFKKKTYSIDYIEAIKEKYGIKSDYIFSNLADDERNNIEGVVKAFCSLPENLATKYQLVITCSVCKEVEAKYLKYVKESGLDGQLIFTNFISDDELVCLLNNATIASFMSLYEGFGFPIVEAWACGIPVVTSNNSSCGEIALDAAITADPYDITSIRTALCKALTNKNSKKLIENGFVQLEKYNWLHIAENVLKYLKDTISLPKKNIKISSMLDLMIENMALKEKLLKGYEQNNETKIQSKFAENRNQLVVYGIGKIGKQILNTGDYKKIGDTITVICDNAFEGNEYLNVPVIKHNECVEKYPFATYLVTPQRGYITIISDLVKSGIPTKNIVFWDNSRRRFEIGC